MDDLGEKLKNVLSDKDSFAQIMNLAKTLGGNQTPNSAKEEAANDIADNVPLLTGSTGSSGFSTLLDMPQIKRLFTEGQSERLNLLKAIKPYLKEEKRPKIDRITNAISTIETLYKAKDLI